MARWHSLPAVSAVGLAFLLTGRAAGQQPVVAKTPGSDRTATASKTVIEARDPATNMLVWQSKAAAVSVTTFVSDGNPRHAERGHYVTGAPPPK